ncbi:flagellar filament capping protein FliD [Kurthia gibsonii]|uniref:flagellar filament capping protein FliD n=1 Tax=Kurthia gibsonii TaxID=33946 RepID=UPI00114469D2|nr:flagellar filament capping protein FliD [Kurthia gibsonii]GED20695.1 hypothetical protein KGI01_24360 [Kurthia gibsonii]
MVNNINNSNASTSSYSYLQYKNKVTGLASGMDIDSLMEKLMKAESAQMEKLQQQKQKYEWKRDAYREVNTSLDKFQKDLFDKYGLKSSWNSKTANVSANNAIDVKAGANASGNLSVSEITVAKAAQKRFDSQALSTQRISETTKISDIQGLSDKTALETFAGGDGSVKSLMDRFESEGFKMTLTNGQLKVTEQNNTTEMSETTKEAFTKLGFQFNTASQQSTTIKDSAGEIAKTDSKLSDLNLTSGKLTIGSKEIDLSEFASNPDATMSDLMKKIKEEGYNASLTNGKLTVTSPNSSETLQVTSDNAVLDKSFSPTFKTTTSATYVTSGGSGTLTGKNTIQDLLGGSDSESGEFTLNVIQADGTMKETTIQYKNSDTIDSLMSKMNSSGAGVTAIFNNGQFSISANNTGHNANGAEISLVSPSPLFEKLTGQSANDLASNGSNASMTVNGVEYKQSSNVFNIAGYTITANEDLKTGTPIKISSTNDTDKAVDKVKEFVNMYNSLIEDLNKRVSEKKNLSYQPLTDAQKAELKEDEIKKWEEKAKAGLLKGDTNINKALSDMRSTLTNFGSGTDNMLSKIGITTSKTWSDNGKLEIDEDKLRKAIEKDPEALSRIFTGDDSTDNKGIASSLRTTAQNAVKNIEKTAGKASSTEETYTLGRNLKDVNTKIDDWKDRLKTIEERYWKQFAAMESAIQKANTQSSIFTQ